MIKPTLVCETSVLEVIECSCSKLKVQSTVACKARSHGGSCYNPSARKTESGGSEAHSHRQLYSKFLASLG